MTKNESELTSQKLKISGSFAKRLKELREEKGVLQSDVAKMLGIATPSYSNWEQGRTLPAITYLPILAEYFGVTTDNLLGINRQDAIDRLRQRVPELDVVAPVLFSPWGKRRYRSTTRRSTGRWSWPCTCSNTDLLSNPYSWMCSRNRGTFSRRCRSACRS